MGDRRRDQRRRDGRLPPTPPDYGLWRWLRHPWLTGRAKSLALADPSMGLFASLTAAKAAVKSERRQVALAALLRRKLARGRDRLAAEIAVTTYDLDEIAARLAASADYHGLIALIAAELEPARMVTVDRESTPAADEADLEQPAPCQATSGCTCTDGTVDQAAVGRSRPSVTSPVAPGRGTVMPAAGSALRMTETAARVARVRERNPRLSTMDIARLVGVTDRTVRRHLAALRHDSKADTTGGADTGRSDSPSKRVADTAGDPVPDSQDGRPDRGLGGEPGRRPGGAPDVPADSETDVVAIAQMVRSRFLPSLMPHGNGGAARTPGPGSGALARAKLAAAEAERRRAQAAGQPYGDNVAAHLVDTTWTDQAEPPAGWARHTHRINSSHGSQSGQYPVGYQPTSFDIEDPQ